MDQVFDQSFMFLFARESGGRRRILGAQSSN
jgi:hypothetical protein